MSTNAEQQQEPTDDCEYESVKSRSNQQESVSLLCAAAADAVVCCVLLSLPVHKLNPSLLFKTAPAAAGAASQIITRLSGREGE